MNNDRIDNILKSYFDYKFSPTIIGSLIYDNQSWFGFNIPEKKMVILGAPEIDKDDIWFSNGPYFESGPRIFDINWNIFNKAMERYVKKKEPTLNFKRIL